MGWRPWRRRGPVPQGGGGVRPLHCRLVAMWAWLVMLAMPAQAAPTVDSSDGAWLIDRAELAQGECTRSDAACDWRPVTLPDHWGISKRQGLWTYRVTLPATAGDARGQPQALWVPRAGDRLEIWLNGMPLAQYGDVHGQTGFYGYQPLWVPVGAALLLPAGNELRIVVASGPSGVSGLSRIHWGPPQALRGTYLAQQYVILGGAVGRIILCTMACLITLAMAWRMHHPHAALFALSAGMWAVLDILKLRTEPWPDETLWYALKTACFGLTLLCGSWLQWRMLHVRSRWLALAALLTALALPWVVWRATQVAHFSYPLVRWMWATMAVGTCTTVYAWATLWRHPSKAHLMIALGCLGCVALSFTDNWTMHLSGDPLGYEHVPLTPYMAISLLLGISASVYVRIDRALRIEQVHKVELERQVQAQRSELEGLHAREQARVKEEAVAAERARLMRDMHDGLGSQLVGLMSTVQSGQFTRDELTDEVRQTMDQLRLTIDSLEPMGGDLSSLLGQLRFRLEPRLQKVGIQVDWKVGELPGADHLGAAELASLLRLLHEVFTNIIKHAKASKVTVRGRHDAQAGRHIIDIADDGQGFDISTSHLGRGLHNMRTRAEQLHGELTMVSQPAQGCHVRLTLPTLPASA